MLSLPITLPQHIREIKIYTLHADREPVGERQFELWLRESLPGFLVFIALKSRRIFYYRETSTKEVISDLILWFQSPFMEQCFLIGNSGIFHPQPLFGSAALP